jgi:glycine cleavage system transcriptional repressor
MSGPRVAISAIGADRPGIVAAMTWVLFEQGCNLEDTSMSILRGHFAMMLVVATPPGLSPPSLEQALAGPAAALDVVVVVRPLPEAGPLATEGSRWTISVHGADRPGIVHRVTSLVADHGGNVVDLSTRVIGEETTPVYAMFLDVSVPGDGDPERLARGLAALAEELGVACAVQPADADIL